MHDWYEKGYIEPDFISDNSNWNSPDYANAITTGDAGIFYCALGQPGRLHRSFRDRRFCSGGYLR